MAPQNNTIITNIFNITTIQDNSSNRLTIVKSNDSDLLMFPNINKLTIAGNTMFETVDYILKRGDENSQTIELDIIYEAIKNSVNFSKISFGKTPPTPKEFIDKTFKKIFKLNNKFIDYIWVIGPKSYWHSTYSPKTFSNMKKTKLIGEFGESYFKDLCLIASPYRLNKIYDDYIIGIPKDKLSVYHTHNLWDAEFKYCVVSKTTDEVVYFPIDF